MIIRHMANENHRIGTCTRNENFTKNVWDHKQFLPPRNFVLLIATLFPNITLNWVRTLNVFLHTSWFKKLFQSLKSFSLSAATGVNLLNLLQE